MQADHELNELKGFIADLKADRAAQKDKEKREAWTKYVSMSIMFIAVLAAIATQWAGKYASRTLVELNKSTLNQALASDNWSEFQANSIKKNLYETVLDQLPKDVAANHEEAAKREAAVRAKIAKYSKAQEESSRQAKDYENERNSARAAAKISSEHGGPMGMAVGVFQISIALGSICLVTKKKWLWYLSLILAAGATGQMVWVWLR